MNQNIVMSVPVQNVYMDIEKAKYEATSKNGVHSSINDPVAFIKLRAVFRKSASFRATPFGPGIDLPYQQPNEEPAAMLYGVKSDRAGL